MRILNHPNSKIVNVFWERPVAHVFILKRFARNENRYHAGDFSIFFFHYITLVLQQSLFFEYIFLLWNREL